jgi:anti-sigma factor RsiW
MNCTKVRQLLASFTCDGLRQRVKARVEEHLEACPDCRKEHETLLKTVSLVESLAPVEPDRDAWAGVYSAISRPAPVRGLRPAIAKAIVAVGLAGALAFAAGRYAHQPEPAPVVASSAGAMAPYIQNHMALVSTDAFSDPANAGLVESVSER